MKRIISLTLALALVLALGVALAQPQIFAPEGEGQIGLGAIVLQNDMPVYEKADEASKTVMTLPAGRHIILMDIEEDWATCVLSDDVDGAPAGYVKTNTLLINPAYLMTQEATTLYAWNDLNAFTFETVDEYTLFPVMFSDGEWAVVSYNGASAWIYMGAAE